MPDIRSIAAATRPYLAAAASAACLGLASPLPATAVESPFNQLSGFWSGGGQLRLGDGQSEHLSCKAVYNPKDSGASLGMSLRCASASYKIELRSSLRYADGRITGSWEERTFNAGGELSGRATNGTIQLAFSGNVSGTLSVSYGGSSQKVALSTKGSNLAGLSLSLSKG